jgi:hypothetical protein
LQILVTIFFLPDLTVSITDMKVFGNSLFTTLFTIIFVGLHGQGLDIPRPSPKASVGQMIGVCSIDISYSRPSAKGRTVFGNLVPFDEVWRTGANEATTIIFSHEVQIDETKLPAGKYGLFTIPGEQSWIIIFNKEWDQWGAYNYNEKNDVIRVEVPVTTTTEQEMFTIGFVNVSKTGGMMNLTWSTTNINIPITTATHDLTLANIEKAVLDAQANWYIYSAAAQYHYYELDDGEQGLYYINIAIALDAPNPAPWMLKSQILAEQKKYVEAISNAEKAMEVSRKYNFWFELEENEEQIALWKTKL